MIRNIIFDLGNVLLSFRPAEYLDKKEYSEEDKREILTHIFLSKEWLLLDNGDITLSEAIERIALNSTLSSEAIGHIFNLRTKIMYPFEKNVNLLPELKKSGYRLYFLSNFPVDIFEKTKTTNSFFSYFDGGVISAEVHHSKPERRIYEIILENYSLKSEECLFIDDLEINVEAARMIGMKGLITFGSNNISQELYRALLPEN